MKENTTVQNLKATVTLQKCICNHWRRGNVFQGTESQFSTGEQSKFAYKHIFGTDYDDFY
jgi:hypothetical protein